MGILSTAHSTACQILEHVEETVQEIRFTYETLFIIYALKGNGEQYYIYFRTMTVLTCSRWRQTKRHLSLNYANIHAISPMIYFLYTTDIFRTKTDIPRIFLEHECIFCRQTSRVMTQST